MAKRTSGGKCPKCSKRFPHTADGLRRFQKHYANAHYIKKKKADSTRGWKVPGFARRRK